MCKNMGKDDILWGKTTYKAWLSVPPVAINEVNGEAWGSLSPVVFLCVSGGNVHSVCSRHRINKTRLRPCGGFPTQGFKSRL